MPNPWVMLLVVFLLLADFGIGFYIGDRHATDKYMLANDSGLITAQNKVITETGQSAAITNQIGGDYDSKTQKVVDDFMHGLVTPSLPAKSAAGGVPALSVAASGVDATTQNRKLKIEQTNKLLCYIQVNDLQNWIRRQQGVYK